MTLTFNDRPATRAPVGGWFTGPLTTCGQGGARHTPDTRSYRRTTGVLEAPIYNMRISDQL